MLESIYFQIANVPFIRLPVAKPLSCVEQPKPGYWNALLSNSRLLELFEKVDGHMVVKVDVVFVDVLKSCVDGLLDDNVGIKRHYIK